MESRSWCSRTTAACSAVWDRGTRFGPSVPAFVESISARGDAFGRDPFERGLLPRRDGFLSAQVAERRPVEDELVHAHLGIAPNELVKSTERREGIDLESIREDRSPNSANITTELSAVLVEKLHLLMCAGSCFSQRQRRPSRLRERLPTQRIPAVSETSDEPQSPRHLPGDDKRRAWLLHWSGQLDRLGAIEATGVVDEVTAQ